MTEAVSQVMGTWAYAAFLSVHDRGAVSGDGDLDIRCIPLWALELVRNKWRKLDTVSLGISTKAESSLQKLTQNAIPWPTEAIPGSQPAFFKSDLCGDQTRLQQLLQTTTPVTHPLQISWI